MVYRKDFALGSAKRFMPSNLLENRRKVTVREIVTETLQIHNKIFSDAKKGIVAGRFSVETVTSWYESGGSRYQLSELAKKKIEDLSVSEINKIMMWHLFTCGNPCRTCGNVLTLDDEFWIITLRYDSIQLCSNCLKVLKLKLQRVRCMWCGATHIKGSQLQLCHQMYWKREH